MQTNRHYSTQASFTSNKRSNAKFNQAKSAKSTKPAKPAKPVPKKADSSYTTSGVIQHTINDRWMPGQDEIIRDTAKSLITSLPYDDRNPVSKMIVDEIILPRYMEDNGLTDYIQTEDDKKELIKHLLDHVVGTNDAYNPGKDAKSGYCPPRICYIESNNQVIIVKQVMDKDDYDYFAQFGYEIHETIIESNQSGEGYHTLVNVKRSTHQLTQSVERTNCGKEESITMSIVTTKEGLIDPNKSKLYINKCDVGKKGKGTKTNNGKIEFGDKFIPDFNDSNKFVELKNFNHPINVRLQDIDYPEMAAFDKFIELRENPCFDNEDFYNEVNKMIVSEPTREKEFYETSEFNRATMNSIKIQSDKKVEAYNYISAKSSGVMSCKTASGFFNMLNKILYYYKTRLFITYNVDSISVNLVNYSTIAGLISVITKINTNTCEYSTTVRQDRCSMADFERKDLAKNSWRLAALATGFMSSNWLGSFPDIKYSTANKKKNVKSNKTPIRTMIDKDNDRLVEILSDYQFDPYALFEYASLSK